MAGLCAAARARELGLDVVVTRKATGRAGRCCSRRASSGGTSTSSRFARSARAETLALQRQVIERLDDGARVAPGARRRGRLGERPATRAPSGCASIRAADRDARAAAGDVGLRRDGAAMRTPLLLATGGFQGDRGLVREHIAPAASYCCGQPVEHRRRAAARAASAAPLCPPGMDEFYGRAMPAPPAAVHGGALRRPRAALRPLRARARRRRRGVRARAGVVVGARPRPGDRRRRERARVVPRRRGRARPSRSAGGRCARWSRRRARRGGRGRAAERARHRGPGHLPRTPSTSSPAITHTIGGVRIDANARVLAATARRSTVSTRQARTRAAISAGGTRAACDGARLRPDRRRDGGGDHLALEVRAAAEVAGQR